MLPLLIIALGIIVLVVVGGLLLVIFAFLNPWAVVAMFGMVMFVVYLKYCRRHKGSR